MNPSLGERFPMLKFAVQADNWLGMIKNRSIFWQLEDRKIHSICILPLLSTAGLAINKENNSFHFYFNQYAKPKWAFGSLGHEIAHTFHFDLKRNPMVEIINPQAKEFLYDFDEEGEANESLVEDFCDEFMKQWLRINTRTKITNECHQSDNTFNMIIKVFSDLRGD